MLLKVAPEDVLEASRTSIDYKGENRFEFSDINDLDLEIRPCHNTARRERR